MVRAAASGSSSVGVGKPPCRAPGERLGCVLEADRDAWMNPWPASTLPVPATIFVRVVTKQGPAFRDSWLTDALVDRHSHAQPRARSYDAVVMVTPVRNRTETLGRLAAVAPNLQSRGVASLRIFGSAGRDAMTDESDVDIVVEFDRPVGAFEFLDLRDELAQTLGRSVDLVTPAAVEQRMWARVEREAVDVAAGS